MASLEAMGWTAVNEVWGVNGKFFYWVFDFRKASCSLFRFVSNYTFGKICFWSPEGRYRGIVIVFCQRNGLLFKLLDASQRVTAVEK